MIIKQINLIYFNENFRLKSAKFEKVFPNFFVQKYVHKKFYTKSEKKKRVICLKKMLKKSMSLKNGF